MDEIRFRHTEEVVHEETKKFYSRVCAWVDRCSTCNHYGRGNFCLVDGTFECWRCFARRRFSEIVGKPEDY